MLKRLLVVTGQHPTLAMKYVLWTIQALVGFIVLLPFYEVEGAPALSQGLSSVVAIKAYGLLMLLPALYGLWVISTKNMQAYARTIENLLFWSFLLFLFFALIRLATFGFDNAVWMSYLMNALFAGIISVRLRWEQR